MNGFDFDSLRDHLAPTPGRREREAVRARAGQLRARARRSRLAVSSISLVVVAALVLGIVASQRDNRPELTIEGPTGTVGSSIANRFVPPTTTGGDTVTLPVTLPDGDTLTLQYPADLGVAQLGFAGGIGVNWPVSADPVRCCGKQVSITYDTIAHVYGDATPIKVYRGAHGEDVPYFRADQQVPPQPNPLNYLVFQFGPWLVQVYDVQHAGDFERPMTDAERVTWARSLTGTVDANGYLVLHAAAPLSIDRAFDGGFGADPGNHLDLASRLYCGQAQKGGDSSSHRRFTQGDGTPGVAWCVGNDLHVSATGTRSFVDGVDRSLRVSDLNTPLGTPTTTTSTTTTTSLPASTPPPALSATWVSPDHGWALQQNGDVAVTTDGGRTWMDIGSVGASAQDGRLRFANGSVGYAFDPNDVFATTDGGRSWHLLDVPFHGAADLAIWNGTVYAASYDTTNASVYVWTTPVGASTWTKHPTGVAIGAGPIPSTQLVLSGTKGWLLQVDRDIVGGAQLTPNGDWRTWIPPCRGRNGPAVLAASSSSDVVVGCSEHDYGGGPVQSSVWFSHDGGVSFDRHLAPGGFVMSPSANTAVVAGLGELDRSTDGGATWRGVAHVAGSANDGAVDGGFTTATQGFIIFGDGTMLMTYDAGATWQEVTLP